MIGTSCVILMPDDTGKTGRSVPLMLEPLMGCPLLGWLAANLVSCGVQRFFVVCHPQYASRAAACMPKQVPTQISTNQQAPDFLHVFLSTAEEEEQEILIVSGPSMCLPPDVPVPPGMPAGPSRIARASRQALMHALDEPFHFVQFLQENGVRLTPEERAWPIDSVADLAAWQPALQTLRVRQLIAAGVRLWDARTTFVDPTVQIAADTELLPGAIVRGASNIGAGCRIGPNSVLENASIGDGTVIESSRVQESSVGAGAAVGPFASVTAGSTVGNGAVIGAGCAVRATGLGENVTLESGVSLNEAKIAARARVGAHTATDGAGATVGEGCIIGAHAVLQAPVQIEAGTSVAAGMTVSGEMPRAGKGKHRVKI